MEDSNFIVANPPEGFKKLSLVNGMKRKAPKIKWGTEYESWGPIKKIKYLQELASTMNHAADVLQKERAVLMAVFEKQEAQIIAVQKRYEEQTNLLNQQLASFNKQKQEVLQRVSRLQKENGQLIKQVKELKNGA